MGKRTDTLLFCSDARDGLVPYELMPMNLEHRSKEFDVWREWWVLSGSSLEKNVNRSGPLELQLQRIGSMYCSAALDPYRNR